MWDSFSTNKGRIMTQRDMAGYLGITPMTLRNWRKDKPNLYKIIMQGFAVEEAKETLRKTLETLDNVTTGSAKIAKNPSQCKNEHS